MRRRIAIGRASPELVEDLLQLVGPGQDDPDADGAQVEQQAKVVQITIIEWILVVPLDFQRHGVLEAIYLVCRGIQPSGVHLDGRLELFLAPATLRQEPVNIL